MNRILASLGTTAILGSSLLFGAGAANAGTCPAGQHWNEMGGGSGFCSPDASGGGTGANGIYTAPGGTTAPAPQAPVFQNPNPYQAPVYGNAPAPAPRSMQLPAAPGPAVQAPVTGNRPDNAPAAPLQGPSWTPAGNGGPTTPAQTPQSITPVPGEAPVEGQKPAPAAAPAEASASAPAAVLPTTEVQAVAALRSATATPAEKDAALAIVKSRIDAVLTSALDKALTNH